MASLVYLKKYRSTRSRSNISMSSIHLLKIIKNLCVDHVWGKSSSGFFNDLIRPESLALVNRQSVKASGVTYQFNNETEAPSWTEARFPLGDFVRATRSENKNPAL